MRAPTRAGGAWLAIVGVLVLLLFHVFVLGKVLGRLSLLDDRQGNSQTGTLALIPLVAFGAATCVGGAAVAVYKLV